MYVDCRSSSIDGAVLVVLLSEMEMKECFHLGTDVPVESTELQGLDILWLRLHKRPCR